MDISELVAVQIEINIASAEFDEAQVAINEAVNARMDTIIDALCDLSNRVAALEGGQ
jgi:hypothetical protein